MKRKLILVTSIALIIFALLLWAPWINGTYAKEHAVSEFERTWLNVDDGCGFACHGCGAAAWKKVPFGAQVTLEYACGTVSLDSSVPHQQADVFVSFLGKVYGLPTPQR
jgi:hypothetical protein